LATLLIATPVWAQELKLADPPSCASWNAAKPLAGQTSPVRMSGLAWVFDAIAAHDAEPDRDYYGGGIDLTDGIDANEIASWMDGYCRAHSEGNLGQAAAALIGELSLRWTKSHSLPDRR
jgi:hypothetical protein